MILEIISIIILLVILLYYIAAFISEIIEKLKLRKKPMIFRSAFDEGH